MLRPDVKEKISKAVQEILQLIDDYELPKGEIPFILHIDGEDPISWANIRNMSDRQKPVPVELIQNHTNKRE